MHKQIIQNTQQRMHKSIEVLQHEVAKLRGGRAHPSLIEHLKVVYYDNEVPLNQAANITVGDARTLVVTPWDKSVAQAIEKAILNANLGLNPVAAGNVIRVPLPALTEERRRDMIKVVRAECESGRVAVRNVRRDANTEIKNLLKDKKITEDEERRAQEEIQKLTDKSIAEIEKLLEQKEKELMEV